MSIDERLSRLERGNRLWKRFAFILLVLFVSFVAFESVELVRPPMIEARSLAILDAEGRVRMRIGCNSDGEISQEMFDASGTRRSSLKAGAGGTFLGLTDASRVNSLAANAGGGEVWLAMSDDQNAVRLYVKVRNEGSPLIRMCESNGETIWEAPR